MAGNDEPPARYAVDTIWSSNPAKALTQAAKHFLSAPSPDSLIHLSFRTDPTLDSGAAFSVLSNTLIFSSAVWTDERDDERNQLWSDELVENLAGITNGFYINEVDFIRHPSRLTGCFSASAAERLDDVRDRYDPEGLLRVPVAPLEDDGIATV
jgi:hypothetical protein